VKIVLLLNALFGLAIGGYAYVNSHSVVASAFLGLAAFSLAQVVSLLLRSARALVTEPPSEVEQATGRRKKELEREKASLLKALKELEFDHEMGKVSDVDFREIGGQYRARAMRVLRQLDEQGADYKSLVERELKARLGAKTEVASEAASEPERPTCSCGAANDPDAVFCKKCGKKVAA
jgi:hypothetical protein